MEEWRDIPGYEGAYQVSDQGRVRSLERRVRRVVHGMETTRRVPPKMLRPGAKRSGHVSVALGKGNSKDVHVLVLLAFVGPRPERLESLHGDGNPTNNRLNNLRYGTRSENGIDCTHHNRRKLTVEEVRAIKERAKQGFAYGERYQLALSLGINSGALHHILTGRQYASVS